MLHKTSKSFVKDLKKLAVTVWILFTAFWGFMMWSNNIYFGKGTELDQLNRRENELRLENQLLENEIASASALRHISVKAKEMGFIPPKIIYIK